MVISSSSRPAISSSKPHPLWYRFWHWWVTELAASIPVRVRQWWRGTENVILLELREDSISFFRQVEVGPQEILAVGRRGNELDMPLISLQQILLKTAGPNYRLHAVLPTAQVLFRSIVLPAAVTENLRQTLGYELDRYTPFRADQAYFDYFVSTAPSAGHDDISGVLVELAAAPRKLVDGLLGQIASLGLVANGVIVRDDLTRGLNERRNFMPSANLDRKSSDRVKQRLYLMALSGVLLVATLAIPIWQKRSTAIALLAPLAEIKATAHETDAAREQLTKLAQDSNFLPDKKWASPSATYLLEELSRLLPDDTFLMQLDFDGKSIHLTGETGSASSVMEVIESSPLFKDTAFRSPLTKVQGTPADRFQIAATVEAMGQVKGLLGLSPPKNPTGGQPATTAPQQPAPVTNPAGTASPTKP